MLNNRQALVREAMRRLQLNSICERVVMTNRELFNPACRVLYAVLVAGSVIACPAWGASGQMLAWPQEQDAISAMRKGAESAAKQTETISIRSMHAIKVDQDEDAFLISVWLPDRGRNLSVGTFLYRPRLKQAQELGYTQSLGTRYVPGYYKQNHFVLLEQYESGQGSEQFSHALVRFVGWQAQVLHEARFGNNLGACKHSSADSRDCRQTWVQFQLLPGDGPKAVDLVEISTRVVGVGKSRGKSSVKTRRMTLNGDRFTVLKP